MKNVSPQIFGKARRRLCRGKTGRTGAYKRQYRHSDEQEACPQKLVISPELFCSRLTRSAVTNGMKHSIMASSAINKTVNKVGVLYSPMQLVIFFNIVLLPFIKIIRTFISCYTNKYYTSVLHKGQGLQRCFYHFFTP